MSFTKDQINFYNQLKAFLLTAKIQMVVTSYMYFNIYIVINNVDY